MIPNEPPRNPGYGFLYFPPYRVQGYSIAGEETFVQVPELDICFDIGRAPRLALTSPYVAISHGHMDHTAGLAYYFSQRNFQGMGMGTVLCHPSLEGPIHKLMRAWIDIEAQRSPYKVIPIGPEAEQAEFELKNNIFLRAFATDHTVPSLGYVVIEKRSKLRDELAGLPQEKLVAMKKAGEQITYTREIPLVAYTGDTSPGAFFELPEVTQARILVTECTFMDDNHRDRARIGKHLHISDLIEMLPNLQAEHIVLTHLSRRTHLGQARHVLNRTLPQSDRDRIHVLMDGRTNRARYAEQVEQAEAAEAEEA